MRRSGDVEQWCWVKMWPWWAGLALVGTVAACSGQRNGLHPAIPTSSRQISFAQRQWFLRESQFPTGAGPNFWSGGRRHVWVDQKDRLHLRLAPDATGRWWCAEAMTPIPRQAKVVVEVQGDVSRLDPLVVAGIFLYQSDHSEVDVELSRWGDARAANAQFVVVPAHLPGNRFRFDLPSAPGSRHVINWDASGVAFSSQAQGHPPVSWQAPKKEPLHEGQHFLHLNLWLMGGQAPKDPSPVELVVSRVTVR